MVRPALALLLASAAFAQAPQITGYWEGVLASPAGRLRIGVHISQEAAALQGKLDSIDQSAFGLSLENVIFEQNELRFELRVAGASYKGVLNDAGDEISGTFTQGGDMPLVLKKTARSAEPPKRPQVPVKPYPYKEDDVTFPNKSAEGVTLAGTLTMPRGKAPFPAVVLITGSGPQDRNESLMGHKPFLILADRLTRQGIAVLRYDDRGTAGSTGNFAGATTQDFATDAAAAVDYLKTRSEIAPARIGLLGHSEGGIVAPLVANSRRDIAFVVLLAGTALPGDKIIIGQSAAILKAQGAAEDMIRRQQVAQESIFTAVKDAADEASAAENIRKIVGESPRAAAQIKSVTSPWFRNFLCYDPAPALAKLTVPVLALNGELDLQVLARENLPVIEASLKEGGNPDYRVMRLPNLNHLFQTAKTGAPAEYGQIEETMAPAALDVISNWIRAHTGLQ